MKKILIALCFMLGFAGISTAQTVKKKAPTTTRLEKVKPAATTTTATVATEAPVKKDGTPDKRFKANKSSKAGPLKKDGTPDMRYNKNKKKV